MQAWTPLFCQFFTKVLFLGLKGIKAVCFGHFSESHIFGDSIHMKQVCFFLPLICLKSISLFLQNFYLFIFGCAGSSLLCGLFSSCSEQELLSSCSVWASHCGVFSCCRAWALGGVGFSSCSTWTQFLHSMWGSPGTRDRTSVPSIVRQILNHRTTSEIIISLLNQSKNWEGRREKFSSPTNHSAFI